MTTKKILFVCLGNICRSPTAEGVMLQLVAKQALATNFQIDSAGTGDWHVGEAPDPRTRRHALKRGYDLEPLRARQLTAQDLATFDLIVAMDDMNVRDIEKLGQGLPGEWREKLVKLTDYNELTEHDFVPDPYHQGPEGFELVLDLVEHCCQNLLRQMAQA